MSKLILFLNLPTLAGVPADHKTASFRDYPFPNENPTSFCYYGDSLMWDFPSTRA